MTPPEDLQLIFELEGWTNDRITAELGIIHMLSPDEWVVGRPHSTAIMAAFCHPAPNGGRFNTPDLGTWYAAFDLETALAESTHHRTKELEEIGVFDTAVQMRQYLSDFDADFYDVRRDDPAFAPLHLGQLERVSALWSRPEAAGIKWACVSPRPAPPGANVLPGIGLGWCLTFGQRRLSNIEWQGTTTAIITQLAA